jgi:hypothetical protein
MKAIHRRIMVAIVAAFIGVSAVELLAANLQSQPKKTGEFKATQGTVTIGLSVIIGLGLFVNSYSGHPEVPSLELLYGNGSLPSLAEEVGFIREVLHQLPGLGVDPHGLSIISMRGFAEPGVLQRAALVALHSKAWRSRVTVSRGAERVVEDLLNSLGA